MPISIEELGGLLNGSSASPIEMVQASPETALQDQFFNTPQYQLMYGNNKSMDPNERFQNDPGMQMAMQQGMKPLLGQYAAQGLSQSGALAKALQDYSYNQYSNYIGGQGSLFNNYQNQLQQLTGMGAQNTGSQNAYNSGQNTGQQLGNANMQTGASIGNANMMSGENIASLFGNQGVLGASGYFNTGGAQSSNIMNGMSLAAQLFANQQASQASAGAGAGAMQGSSGSGNYF